MQYSNRVVQYSNRVVQYSNRVVLIELYILIELPSSLYSNRVVQYKRQKQCCGYIYKIERYRASMG